MNASSTPNMTLPQWNKLIEYVLADLTHADGSVRAGAVYTLGQYGGSRTVPRLLQALADEAATVREEAVYALGEFADEPGVQLLLAAQAREGAQTRAVSLLRAVALSWRSARLRYRDRAASQTGATYQIPSYDA